MSAEAYQRQAARHAHIHPPAGLPGLLDPSSHMQARTCMSTRPGRHTPATAQLGHSEAPCAHAHTLRLTPRAYAQRRGCTHPRPVSPPGCTPRQVPSPTPVGHAHRFAEGSRACLWTPFPSSDVHPHPTQKSDPPRRRCPRAPGEGAFVEGGGPAGPEAPTSTSPLSLIWDYLQIPSPGSQPAK